MQATLGARVLSHDGENMGVVKHLILDAATMQVQTLVVEKGNLLSQDVEVPLAAVLQAEEPDDKHRQTVRLGLNAEEVRNLPVFERAQYTLVPEDLLVEGQPVPYGGYFWSPIPSNLTATPGLYPVLLPTEASAIETTGEQAALQQQWERAHAVLEAGSEVIARDGQIVGNLHHLTFDAHNGTLRTLVVRQGTLFARYREIPASAIAAIDDGRVSLNLDAEQIETAEREIVQAAP